MPPMQLPTAHRVIALYVAAPASVNAQGKWAGNAHDAAVNAVRQDLGAARDPEGRERPLAALGRPALRARGLVPGLRQGRGAQRQGRAAGSHLRHRRPLRADRAQPRVRRSLAQAHGRAAHGQHRQARRDADGDERPAPGHRACGRTGAGADHSGPHHRVRRQPYGDARCARLDRDRHRRVGSVPRAADADACGRRSRTACA